MKIILKLLFIMVFININLFALTMVSVPFKDGFIGDLGSNANKANDIERFATLTISRMDFYQNTASGRFELIDGASAQGNDLPGYLRIVLTDGTVYDNIYGAINWRLTNTNYEFGFIPAGGTTIAFGSYSNSSANIGFITPSSTYTIPADGSDISGNAALKAGALLDLLNNYLDDTIANAPAGPVTVTSQTTDDTTPVITGTVELNASKSEYLEVTVNGVNYTTSTGGLVVSGNTWSLQIPNDSNLTRNTTYDVTASIFNNDGYLLKDSTLNELVITSAPPYIQPIADINLTEDFGTYSVNIIPSDPDNDNLQLFVETNNSSIFSLPANSTDWIPYAYYNGGLDLNLTSILNKNGSVELNVTVQDPTGGSYTETFIINVTPVDDAPVASLVTASVAQGNTSGFITYNPNYTDVDVGDSACTLRIHTDPNASVGRFETNTSGSWVTINASFDVNMTDINNYRFNAVGTGNADVNWSIKTSSDCSNSSLGLWSNIAQGTVTVYNGVNNPPELNVTIDGSLRSSGYIYTMYEDTPSSVITLDFNDDLTPAANLQGIVISSDSTLIDVSDMTINRVSPTQVTIIMNPKANRYGDVNITLGATDGSEQNTSVIQVVVNPVNDVPLAFNFEKTINEDTNYLFSNLNPTTVYQDTNDSQFDSNETYPEIFNIITLPQHGKLHLGDGVALSSDTNVSIMQLSSLVYTPAENNTTTVTFDWKAYDGADWTQTKVATIHIVPFNDIPIANDDNGTLNDVNITLNLLENDTDGDGNSDINTSSVMVLLNPLNGSIVNHHNGTVTYIPDGNFSSQDTFSYRIYDLSGTSSNVAVVTITGNSRPTIDTPLLDQNLTDKNGTVNCDINISDNNGDDLNLTVESNNTDIIEVTPNWENLLKQGDYDGVELDYNLTTKNNMCGIVRITVKVNDGIGSDVLDTYDINVTCINDAPIFTNSVDGDGILRKTITQGVRDTGIVLTTSDDENDTVTLVKDGGDDATRFILETNGSLYFNFDTNYSSPVDSGNDNNYTVDIKAYDADNNTYLTVIITIIDSTLHKETFGDQTTEAISNAPDTNVTETTEKIETIAKIDENTTVTVDMNRSTGAQTHTLVLADGKKTVAEVKMPGAHTTIEANGTIETKIDVDDVNITVIAKPDGTAEHRLKFGDDNNTWSTQYGVNPNTTVASSSVIGAKTTVVKDDDNKTKIETVAPMSLCSGGTLEGIIITYADGKSISQFKEYDSNGDFVKNIDTIVSGIYEAGNVGKIYEDTNDACTKIIEVRTQVTQKITF